MSVWIAGATVAVGGYSAYSAKKAGDKSSAAQGAATEATLEMDRERLDFEYEKYDEDLARYDDWQAIYGPIEENLGEFYNNLTPETYTAAGLEYNQEAFQKQKTQSLQTLAQRGLNSSGITAALETSMGVSKAEADATTRRDAPFKVAQEKSNFLSQGKGGPTYGPSGATVGQAISGQGTPGALQNEANIASANSSSLWGSAGNMLSTGINYYAQNSGPSANQGAPIVDSGAQGGIGFNPTTLDLSR